MRNRSRSTPVRPSPKDRFISVLHSKKPLFEPEPPWFKKRENFFPLLMIFVFFIVLFIVKVTVDIKKQWQSTQIHSGFTPPESQEEPMDYDEAVDIFTGKKK